MNQIGRNYNVFIDACNGEWLESRWEGNVCHVGVHANGTGTVRRVCLDAGSLDRMRLDDLNALLVEVTEAVARRRGDEMPAESHLVQRNGPVPKSVRVYNTYTDDRHCSDFDATSGLPDWGREKCKVGTFEPTACRLGSCAEPLLTVSAAGEVKFSPKATIDLDGLTVDWLRMVRALADEAIRRKLEGMT